MRIGEAAELAGLNTSAIRFYEDHGVLPRPVRRPSGYRDYAEDDVDLIRFVRLARELGMPLDDIREVSQQRVTGKPSNPAVSQAITRWIHTVQIRIAELEELRTELIGLADTVDGESED